MKPEKLIPTLDLVHRALAAETAYTVSRMQVLERIPGNPIGIAVRRLDDGAVALMARHRSTESSGCAPGMRRRSRRSRRGIASTGWRGVSSLSPGDYAAGLGRELARLDHYQSGFHAGLIGVPEASAPPVEGIVVEAVSDAAAMEDYLDAYVTGWG